MSLTIHLQGRSPAMQAEATAHGTGVLPQALRRQHGEETPQRSQVRFHPKANTRTGSFCVLFSVPFPANSAEKNHEVEAGKKSM